MGLGVSWEWISNDVCCRLLQQLFDFILLYLAFLSYMYSISLSFHKKVNQNKQKSGAKDKPTTDS